MEDDVPSTSEGSSSLRQLKMEVDDTPDEPQPSSPYMETKSRRQIKPPSRLYHTSQVADIIANSTKQNRLKRLKNKRKRLRNPPQLVKEEPRDDHGQGEDAEDEDEDDEPPPKLIFGHPVEIAEAYSPPPPPPVRTFRALEGMRAQDIVQKMADRGHILWIGGELKWVGAERKDEATHGRKTGSELDDLDEDDEDEGIDCKEESDEEKKILASMGTVTLKTKKTGTNICVPRAFAIEPTAEMRMKKYQQRTMRKNKLVHAKKIKRLAKAMKREVRKVKKVTADCQFALNFRINLENHRLNDILKGDQVPKHILVDN